MKAVAITIRDDLPGQPTALTLGGPGDVELSIALAPAECIAIAGELIQAARRRMGRADWPSTFSIFEDRGGDGPTGAGGPE